MTSNVGQEDPLLAELKGDISIAGTQVDPPPVTDRTDLLEVAPDKPLPLAKALDARHSTAAGGKGYAITVTGDYFADAGSDNPGRKLKKPYTVVVNIPSLGVGNEALSLIRKRLLDAAIRRDKNYADSRGHRTARISDVRPLSPASPESTNIRFMSREALEGHAKFTRIPLDLGAYAALSTDILREAIADYTINPKGFEARETARQAQRQQDAELAAINPGLVVEDQRQTAG